MKSLLSLLVHLGVLQICLAASKCYYPNGDESMDYPCDPDAEDSVCCADASVGFACLSNKLCLSPGGRFARGSCTDRTWKSPECNDVFLCTHQDDKGWDMISCSNVTGTDTSYCCDKMPNDCCNSGNGRLNVGQSPIFTWAMWNDEPPGYIVQTPLAVSTSTSTSASTTSTSTSTTSTDTSDAASTSTPTDGPKETSSSATNQPSESEESSQSTGLSTAAQAGIGVGAAVGALLVAAVAYLWWKLDKTQKELKEGSQWQGAAAYPPPPASYYPQGSSQKHELPGDRDPYELAGQQYSVQGDGGRAELPVASAHPSYSVESPVTYNPSAR